MTKRGNGSVYRPTYKDRKTGEVRQARTWWLYYSASGERIRESADTESEAEAKRLLKLRAGQAAIGVPVGTIVNRTKVRDLLNLVEG